MLLGIDHAHDQRGHGDQRHGGHDARRAHRVATMIARNSASPPVITSGQRNRNSIMTTSASRHQPDDHDCR